ncbi:MAG: carboxypeptidase regulatory-like domain-containing protein, partial [Myxococcota bacterium]
MVQWVALAVAGTLAATGVRAAPEEPDAPATPVDTPPDEAPAESPPDETPPGETPVETPPVDTPPTETPLPSGETPAEPVREEPPKINTEVDRSQRARLRGRVLTYGEREPIGGAVLVFASGRSPVESADDGSFSVFLPPGEHEITIRAQGFDDLVGNVTLTPKQDLELEYRMDRALDSPVYRTVVKHERQVAVSSTTLRDEELRSVPGSRGDPLRVVSSLPGVGQLAGFLPYVVVRGAAPGNTGYYLDGTRVPILFHVAIGPSVIHPYFIDAVDFYPSGAPVRLGRYASGIIEARTKSARKDRLHGDIELKLTDAAALLEIPLDRRRDPNCTEKKRKDCEKGPARGALTLAGRYSYTAAILSLAQANAKIQYWDYQARFDHTLGRHMEYTAFAYGSFDNLGLKEQTDPETGEIVVDDAGRPIAPPPILRFQFHRIDNRIRQRLRGGGKASYAVVLGLDQTGVTTLGTNEWRVAPRVDFMLPVKDNVRLHFGVDQEVQVFRLAEQLDSLSDIGGVEDLALLFSDRTVTASGAYFDVEIEKNNFQVRPGVRADLYVQSGFSPYLPNARGVTNAIGVDPRLLMRQTLGERWALRQSLGIYHQPPSSPIPIPGIESFGFERGLQRNTQGSFGYEFQVVRDALRLEQEAYVGRLTNLQDYELGDTEFEIEELEDV